MSVEFTDCTKCGRSFRRDVSQTWRIKCVPCWKAEKGPANSALESMKERCADLERQLRVATAQQVTTTPTKPVIRFLIKAAHPDLHGGSDEATAALRWLLSIREERTQHD